jgi:transcriptional regulator with XRE-family HTH domain
VNEEGDKFMKLMKDPLTGSFNIPLPGKEQFPRESNGSEDSCRSAFRDMVAETTPEALPAFDQLAWFGDIRRALYLARAAAGMTQKGLADKIGIDQSEISRLENKMGPTVELGTIKRYLDRCDAEVGLTIILRKDRRVILDQLGTLSLDKITERLVEQLKDTIVAQLKKHFEEASPSHSRNATIDQTGEK